MAGVIIDTELDIKNVRLPDVIGLWEVIRIDEGEISTYPWIRGRFMFNFLDEEVFVCYKEGKHSNGTWELASNTWEDETLFSIKMNNTFEYAIIKIDEDEMIITDWARKYLLTRKL